MRLHLIAFGKGLLGLSLAGDIFSLPLGLFQPRVDGLLLLHDTDAAFEFLKRHPRQALGMEGHQPVLVIVMIRRAEVFIGHTALSHEGEVTLGPFSLRLARFVKFIEVLAQGVPHGLILVEPRSAIELAGEQALGHFAARLFLHAQPDGVTRRALEHEQRNLKERIGTAGELDLFGDGFHAIGVRHKIHLQIQLRRLWAFKISTTRIAAPLVPRPPAIVITWSALIAPAFALWSSITARSPVIPASASVIPIASRTLTAATALWPVFA